MADDLGVGLVETAVTAPADVGVTPLRRAPGVALRFRELGAIWLPVKYFWP